MLQPHKKFSSYTGWKGHIYAAKELNAVIYLAALNSTYRPNTRPGMHSGQPQKHQLGTASSAQLQERVAAPQGCGAMVDKASGGSVTLLCPLHRARADSPHQHTKHLCVCQLAGSWAALQGNRQSSYSRLLTGWAARQQGTATALCTVSTHTLCLGCLA